MSNIRFYIPKNESVPTDLRLYVDDVYVKYNRIDNGFRFDVLLEDHVEAMKVVEKIIEKIKSEHDEPKHGVSWRTKTLKFVQQDERYRISTIIDWTYYVRDSY